MLSDSKASQVVILLDYLMENLFLEL